MSAGHDVELGYVIHDVQCLCAHIISDELRSAHWDPCYAQTLDLNAIGVKEHAKGLQRIVVVDACLDHGVRALQGYALHMDL